MDNLLRVSQILTNCLTTETLQKYCPTWKKGNIGRGIGDKGVRNKLFVDLFEHSGVAVAGALNRKLTRDEVTLLYNRVRQFMIARGLD